MTPLSVDTGLAGGGNGTGNISGANGSADMSEGNTDGVGSMGCPVADKYAKKLRGESGVPSARTGRAAAAGIRSGGDECMSVTPTIDICFCIDIGANNLGERCGSSGAGTPLECTLKTNACRGC